jgi:deazaflavin-dependent oxidoreductase (nitroreductase family)
MPRRPDEVAWDDGILADFHEHAGQITRGRLAGANLLLMTSIGAKSGEPRISPLGYTRDGDRYVVVGSNSGLPHQPAWLANIRANPVVSVEVGIETFEARATITAGAERQRLWAAHVAALPHFATYEKMTERELQVVAIERLAENA